MGKKTLPVLFLENMKKIFHEFGRPDEFDLFLQSFSEEPNRGIRMNSLKIHSIKEEEAILRQIRNESEANRSFEMDRNNELSFARIPWSDDGYYISNEFFPGRHFFYLAGLFYVQEPSAMLPANVLDAKPGEHILDLCAAPGGKTAKIAADMKGKGILVSNDINETRVKALVRNVELMGCTNAVVLNDTPEHIAKQLPGYFDKILLDAPCSGEGMFRRDPDAMDSWEKFGNQACAEMQRDILSCVDVLLKPGGILVYSTCTFSTMENEEMIQSFLGKYPWYEVLPIEKSDSIDSGFSREEAIRNTVRIFPHHSKGEGHFCAKLRKNPDRETSEKDGSNGNENSCSNIKIETNSIMDKANGRKSLSIRGSTKNENNLGKDVKKDSCFLTFNDFIESFQAFSKDVLTTECIDAILATGPNHFQIVQGHVYTLPEAIPSFDGLKIAKKGLYLGEMKFTKSKIVFEPSHSFLLSRKSSDFVKSISFSTSDPMLLKYIKGETIFFPQYDPADPNPADPKETGTKNSIENSNYEVGRYIPVCVQGFPIGWGKGMQGNMIKNMYPQGWRR